MINEIQNKSICSYLEHEYQSRPVCERIRHEALKIFHSYVYFASLAPHFINYFFNRSPSFCTPSSEENGWRKNNSGLFVFITGLKAHPVWAAPYLSKIQAEHPDVEVRIPSVPHRGDCSLEEATEPIVAMVRDYIQKNPGKKICLIGVSNGGRIAGYTETLLRNENAKIRVTGIAGVFFGSKRMEDLTAMNIAPRLYHPAVLEEFKVGSERAQTLLNAMRAPMPEGQEQNRSYEFYSTTNDWHIPNFASCLPILGKGERHTLISGHGHLSIIDAVCETELQRAYAWMLGDSVPQTPC